MIGADPEAYGPGDGVAAATVCSAGAALASPTQRLHGGKAPAGRDQRELQYTSKRDPIESDVSRKTCLRRTYAAIHLITYLPRFCRHSTFLSRGVGNLSDSETIATGGGRLAPADVSKAM